MGKYISYFNKGETFEYHCICGNDPNTVMIHKGCIEMTEKLCRLLFNNEDLDSRFFHIYDDEYKLPYSYNFPFFYGDEYLLKLFDNDEELIKKYMYDEMYKRIVEKL